MFLQVILNAFRELVGIYLELPLKNSQEIVLEVPPEVFSEATPEIASKDALGTAPKVFSEILAKIVTESIFKNFSRDFSRDASMNLQYFHVFKNP